MKPQTVPIKVFIVDDHELLRKGCCMSLQNQPGIEIIGEAENGLQLLEMLPLNMPDVILADIKMPVMDGIELTKIVTRDYPQVVVIALSAFNDDYNIMSMVAAGAKGYVLKGSRPKELAEAIETVHKNQNYFCTSTRHILSGLIEENIFDPVKNQPIINLTENEKRVLRMICMEKKNNEISAILNISVRTVEYYRTRLFDKTNTNTIAGLAIFAMRFGIYNHSNGH